MARTYRWVNQQSAAGPRLYLRAPDHGAANHLLGSEDSDFDIVASIQRLEDEDQGRELFLWETRRHNGFGIGEYIESGEADNEHTAKGMAEYSMARWGAYDIRPGMHESRNVRRSCAKCGGVLVFTRTAGIRCVSVDHPYEHEHDWDGEDYDYPDEVYEDSILLKAPVEEYAAAIRNDELPPEYAGGYYAAYMETDGEILALEAHTYLGPYQRNYDMGRIRLVVNPPPEVAESQGQDYLGLSYTFNGPNPVQCKALLELFDVMGYKEAVVDSRQLQAYFRSRDDFVQYLNEQEAPIVARLAKEERRHGTCESCGKEDTVVTNTEFVSSSGADAGGTEHDTMYMCDECRDVQGHERHRASSDAIEQAFESQGHMKFVVVPEGDQWAVYDYEWDDEPYSVYPDLESAIEEAEDLNENGFKEVNMSGRDSLYQEAWAGWERGIEQLRQQRSGHRTATNWALDETPIEDGFTIQSAEDDEPEVPKPIPTRRERSSKTASRNAKDLVPGDRVTAVLYRDEHLGEAVGPEVETVEVLSVTADRITLRSEDEAGPYEWVAYNHEGSWVYGEDAQPIDFYGEDEHFKPKRSHRLADGDLVRGPWPGSGPREVHDFDNRPYDQDAVADDGLVDEVCDVCGAQTGPNAFGRGPNYCDRCATMMENQDLDEIEAYDRLVEIGQIHHESALFRVQVPDQQGGMVVYDIEAATQEEAFEQATQRAMGGSQPAKAEYKVQPLNSGGVFMSHVLSDADLLEAGDIIFDMIRITAGSKQVELIEELGEVAREISTRRLSNLEAEWTDAQHSYVVASGDRVVSGPYPDFRTAHAVALLRPDTIAAPTAHVRS